MLVSNAYQTVSSSSSIFNGGDSQISTYDFRGKSTSATPIVLTADNLTPNTSFPSTNQLGIWNQQMVQFRAMIVAKNISNNTDTAAWEVKGLISGNAGSAVIIGTPIVTLIAANAGAISAGWGVVGNVSVSASTSFLHFNCTGVASTTIYWVARIETVEVW